MPRSSTWRRAVLACAVALVSALVSARPAQAQSGAVDGHASIGVDHLPNVDDTTELRGRLFVRRGWSPGPWRIRGRVLVEGLGARRARQRLDARIQVRAATVGRSGGAVGLRGAGATFV